MMLPPECCLLYVKGPGCAHSIAESTPSALRFDVVQTPSLTDREMRKTTTEILQSQIKSRSSPPLRPCADLSYVSTSDTEYSEPSVACSCPGSMAVSEIRVLFPALNLMSSRQKRLCGSDRLKCAGFCHFADVVPSSSALKTWMRRSAWG